MHVSFCQIMSLKLPSLIKYNVPQIYSYLLLNAGVNFCDEESVHVRLRFPWIIILKFTSFGVIIHPMQFVKACVDLWGVLICAMYINFKPDYYPQTYVFDKVQYTVAIYLSMDCAHYLRKVHYVLVLCVCFQN